MSLFSEEHSMLMPGQRLAQACLAEDAGEADQDSAEASVFEAVQLTLRA